MDISQISINEWITIMLIIAQGGVTYYHADYVSPYWAKGERPVKTIGRHIFYKLVEA